MLPYLLSPPRDWTDECDAALETDFRRLSLYSLDRDQLGKLGRAAAKFRRLNGFDTVRVGLIGQSNLQPMSAQIVGAALRHGILIDIYVSEVGQTMQEVLNDQSGLYSHEPDVVVIYLDRFNYAESFDSLALGNAEAIAAIVESGISNIQSLTEKLRSRCIQVLITNIAHSSISDLGHVDRVTPGTMRHLVNRFNYELDKTLKGTQDALLDVCALSGSIGLNTWNSSRFYHIGKFPHNPQVDHVLAEHIARVIASIRGKQKKCLVVDLDNTIWGGVVGDDGIDGIEIGHGSPRGEAFLAIQRQILDLVRRGVILAVCSKNELSVALDVFRRHPEMLIREKHISCMRINWEDKSNNLIEIAEELNIGLDSLVFLDDNPVERAQIRAFLPAVEVPEIGDDPSTYPYVLSSAGYFEAIQVSEEDKSRVSSYQARRAIAKEASESKNIDDFLRSLQTTITFSSFDELGSERVAQLINKSNQFNLTTRRRNKNQIMEIMKDPDFYTLQIRVKDRFGDYGMVSVLIARKNGTTWEIDTWLMSCRVLRRNIEHAVLNRIVLDARAEGVTTLVGCYVASEKNGVVRNHYQTMGFGQVEEGDITKSILNLDLYQPFVLSIEVKS